MKQLRINKQITNREVESLDRYLTEIGKVDLISPDVEVDLARRIQQGDHVALEKLTKANLRFVVSVAKQYQNRGLSLNDMINEGYIGLIKAAWRFDETRGFKFISYAVWWIRQSIMQALAEQARVVRLPLNRVSLLGKVANIFSDLEQKFQRDPSSEELAVALEMPIYDVEESLLLSSRQLSVDSPFQVGEDGSLLDVLANANAEVPDDLLMYESLRFEIASALSTLSARESQVLTMYYGLNGNHARTLEDIASELHLTRERIRQLKEKATQQLKRSFRKKTTSARRTKKKNFSS